jgi:hypothetical protein
LVPIELNACEGPSGGGDPTLTLNLDHLRDERRRIQDPRAAAPKPALPESGRAQELAGVPQRAVVGAAGPAARSHSATPTLLDL